jgi:hippurate hydrolase
MPIRNRLAELLPEITAWRHDFHAHPELLFDVQRTAGKVAALLRDFGVDEVVEGIGRTGVVGVIRGRRAASDRVIGLRADMDALPISEENSFEHRSTRSGMMHACGHDGHTTMLLGAARHLAQTRDFDGIAHLIFQPGEEGFGGAQAMIEDGLFERFPCDAVYAMHNWPGLEPGTIAVKPGPIMAAADRVTSRSIAPRGDGCRTTARSSVAVRGRTRIRRNPGSIGSMPISFRGITFAGTAPQAWFQSWLGLSASLHASMHRVEPCSIMPCQLRGPVAASRACAARSSPKRKSASQRCWAA